jgi:hypothetical protein
MHNNMHSIQRGKPASLHRQSCRFVASDKCKINNKARASGLCFGSGITAANVGRKGKLHRDGPGQMAGDVPHGQRFVCASTMHKAQLV